jgi:ribokinase
VAKAGGVQTIFNPAPAAAFPDEILTLTDILIPNEVEAGMLVGRVLEGDAQIIEAARELQRRGPQTVLVTLGSRGAVVVEGENAPEWIAVEKVQAVDSTGAGDSFVGSFAYLLGTGRSTADAARRAAGIATLSVLKPGTQTSFPYRDEVISLLRD